MTYMVLSLMLLKRHLRVKYSFSNYITTMERIEW